MIQSIFRWNEAGAKMSKAPPRNTYYLNDIAKSSKAIGCQLQNDEVISLKAFFDADHPRNDKLALFLNDKAMPQEFSLAMESDIFIKLIRPKHLEIRFCPQKSNGKLTRSNVRKCEVSHYPDDMIQENSPAP